MNIYIISESTKDHLGTIDFIPRKNEHILLRGALGDHEFIVNGILYMPNEKGVLVFVKLVEPYYGKMIEEIKWNLR
jgi:hypothetical protein